MRKIEQQMNRAIANKADWSSSNTTVSYNESTDCSSIYLHGHQIASYDHNNQAVKLSSCGWQTVTTKSRLNAILEEVMCGAKVYQRKFEWFFSKCNQTVDFIDGMIILDTPDLQVV